MCSFNCFWFFSITDRVKVYFDIIQRYCRRFKLDICYICKPRLHIYVLNHEIYRHLSLSDIVLKGRFYCDRTGKSR